MKKLGFGCMRLPLLDPTRQDQVDFPQFCAMVDAFLERGFTYFDTAYVYHTGQSERLVREALVKRYPRDSFTLATKLPTMRLKEEGDQERFFQEQLEKCGVEYFDYYLLHTLNEENYSTAQRMGSFAFVQELKKQGKVRKMGFSFHDTAQLLDRILTEHPEVDFVQLQINYLDWDNPGIQSRLCYETAVRHQKQVIVMEPVKGGKLAKLPQEAEKYFKRLHPDWSDSTWALRFAAGLDNVMMVLSGMSNMEQIRENTEQLAQTQPLSEEELSAVKMAVEVLQDAALIPCTACRYCVEGCPSRIPIPEFFALYNAEKHAQSPGFSVNQAYYENYPDTKASSCIACGQCEKACPQHIPVIEWLKKVAQIFEEE